MLDARLSLAASLYERCALGADIGTDHGLLPCYLLYHGVCDRMILADVSPKALAHARDAVRRHHLEDRADLVLADGLAALDRPCGCVSMMGMGGETIRDILLTGKDLLQGAVLVLSAHTEQPLVRRTIQEIGYHIAAERLCRDERRFYIFWRAEPGSASLSPEAIRYGGLLWSQNDSKLLREYAEFRILVLSDRLRGLNAADSPREQAQNEVTRDITWYRDILSRLEE